MHMPTSTHTFAKPFGWCLAALITALPSLALADDYQFDIRGGYSQFSDDINNHDALHGAGTVFFSPVETSGHPLAEAAFMERASSVTLSYHRVELADNESAGPDSFNRHGFTQATLDYYLPSNPLFVSLSVDRMTLKGVNGPDQSNTSWSGALGVTPVDGLLVTSRFHEGQDLSDQWNLNARYVMPSRQFEAMAFQAHYDYSYGHQSALWSLDTYLDRTLSLGIGYNRAISTTDDGTLNLRARKFFTDRFSLSAHYSHHKRFDEYGLKASLRF